MSDGFQGMWGPWAEDNESIVLKINNRP
jgi:hypothetical protein